MSALFVGSNGVQSMRKRKSTEGASETEPSAAKTLKLPTQVVTQRIVSKTSSTDSNGKAADSDKSSAQKTKENGEAGTRNLAMEKDAAISKSNPSNPGNHSKLRNPSSLTALNECNIKNPLLDLPPERCSPALNELKKKLTMEVGHLLHMHGLGSSKSPVREMTKSVDKAKDDSQNDSSSNNTSNDTGRQDHNTSNNSRNQPTDDSNDSQDDSQNDSLNDSLNLAQNVSRFTVNTNSSQSSPHNDSPVPTSLPITSLAGLSAERRESRESATSSVPELSVLGMATVDDAFMQSERTSSMSSPANIEQPQQQLEQQQEAMTITEEEYSNYRSSLSIINNAMSIADARQQSSTEPSTSSSSSSQQFGTISSVLSLRCRLCNYTANNTKNLEKHYKAHSTKRKVCKYCGKAFERPSDLIRHTERHIRDIKLNVPGAEAGKSVSAKASQKKKDMLKCTRCPYTDSSSQALNRHMRSKHLGWYTCASCGESFRFMSSFQIHKANAHNVPDTNVVGAYEKAGYAYSCKKCWINFPDVHSFSEHLQDHHPDLAEAIENRHAMGEVLSETDKLRAAHDPIMRRKDKKEPQNLTGELQNIVGEPKYLIGEPPVPTQSLKELYGTNVAQSMIKVNSPGMQIEVRQGEKVQITVTNKRPAATDSGPSMLRLDMYQRNALFTTELIQAEITGENEISLNTQEIDLTAADHVNIPEVSRVKDCLTIVDNMYKEAFAEQSKSKPMQPIISSVTTESSPPPLSPQMPINSAQSSRASSQSPSPLPNPSPPTLQPTLPPTLQRPPPPLTKAPADHEPIKLVISKKELLAHDKNKKYQFFNLINGAGQNSSKDSNSQASQQVIPQAGTKNILQSSSHSPLFKQEESAEDSGIKITHVQGNISENGLYPTQKLFLSPGKQVDDYTYKCHRCNYVTHSGLKYQQHLEAHQNGRLVCKLCQKACIKISDLTRHWLTHMPTAPLSTLWCNSCSYTTLNRDELELHLRDHYRAANPLPCTLSTERFKELASTLTHLSPEKVAKTPKQPSPEKKANTNIPAPIIEYTNDITGEIAEPVAPPVVAKLIKKKKGIRRRNHDTMKVECPICLQKIYAVQIDLHNRLHHPNEAGAELKDLLKHKIKEGRGGFRDRNRGRVSSIPDGEGCRDVRNCSVCGKQLCNKYYLAIHMKNKHNVNYNCRNCEKFFTNESELTDHMKNCRKKVYFRGSPKSPKSKAPLDNSRTTIITDSSDRVGADIDALLASDPNEANPEDEEDNKSGVIVGDDDEDAEEEEMEEDTSEVDIEENKTNANMEDEDLDYFVEDTTGDIENIDDEEELDEEEEI